MPEPGTPVPRPSRRLPAEPKAEPVPISAPQTGYASVANGGTVEPLSPHSVEAEQSVLGSILIDESALAKVAGFLRPDDFYRATHDTIYSAMLALDKAGSIIDLVTLGDRLRQRGKLDEVGGPAYLASLMAAVPTAVHVEHYARIVASRGLSRRLIAAAGRIAAVGYEELNDPETALARMRSLVDQVTSSWTLDALQVDSVALPDVSPPEDPDAWLLTGFIRPGTTIMVTGPPGSSKSWAARQLGLLAAGGLQHFLSLYQITRPMNVLVVDEDNGRDEEWRREEALLAHLGLQRTSVPRYRRVTLEGVRLDQERWQRWLREQLERHQVDLLVLDPISEFYVGKELRDDPGFRAMLDFLKRLKVDYPTLATVLVHHTRKAEKSAKGPPTSLDEVRGMWGQTPDVIAIMWPLAERRLHWELHKRVPHSRLVLEAQTDGAVAMVADESTSRDKRMSTDNRVLGAIESGAIDWEQIHHATGLSKSGIFKALGRLAQAGMVSKRAPYEVLVDRSDDPLPGGAEGPRTTDDEGLEHADEGGEFVE